MFSEAVFEIEKKALRASMEYRCTARTALHDVSNFIRDIYRDQSLVPTRQEILEQVRGCHTLISDIMQILSEANKVGK